MPVYVVAIIPARGGSKGIPLKNLREVAGKPLIAHVIEACLNAESVDRTIVSTDHEGIATVARQFGAEVPFMRPPELAGDTTTLDPVIHHAVETLERTEGISIDVALTIQPTCPLLSSDTIDRAVKELIEGDWDSVITVRDDRHLRWTIVDGRPTPLYEARVNRQELPPTFCETGALFASRRRVITPTDRLGGNIGLVVTSDEEGVDIDTELDLRLAEIIIRNNHGSDS
ncbi:MAG: acylneuraminate cytidylyltransferase family protein [Armatimonadetes bacterium]|nr:acylneuraminate cytidylyltransferase family protein [Armatimonadota bacterium]